VHVQPGEHPSVRATGGLTERQQSGGKTGAHGLPWIFALNSVLQRLDAARNLACYRKPRGANLLAERGCEFLDDGDQSLSQDSYWPVVRVQLGNERICVLSRLAVVCNQVNALSHRDQRRSEGEQFRRLRGRARAST
jgi:hypothetical protein